MTELDHITMKEGWCLWDSVDPEEFKFRTSAVCITVYVCMWGEGWWPVILIIVFIPAFFCCCLVPHIIIVITQISIFIHIISHHSILKVSEVISGIRQVSKSVLKGDAKPKQEADEAFYNSQKFEVLYCGKVEQTTNPHLTNISTWRGVTMNAQLQVTVMHKKAPPTLVDDCIDKFHQHEVEQKRLRLLNGQRGSMEHNPVEFLIGGEGDKVPPSLTERGVDTESVGVDDAAGGGFRRIDYPWTEQY